MGRSPTVVIATDTIKAKKHIDLSVMSNNLENKNPEKKIQKKKSRKKKSRKQKI